MSSNPTVACPTVAITGLGLWLTHYPTAAAWAQGEPSEAAQKPVGLAFDRRNRRRTGALGRAIGDAVEEAMIEAAVDPVTTPVIVGSAIGEASTMIGLLEQMWRTHEPMSPAAFTVSVHNAASGMISISKKNVGFTTSLASDYDTPAAALLEGVAIVATTGSPVAIVCADEESPRSLLASGTHWDMLAAALVLAPAEATPRRASLTLQARGPVTIAPANLGEVLAKNPQTGLFDLVDAVVRGEVGTIALDRGEGRGYCAELGVGEGA